jgi:hypothetical protein
MLIKVIVLAFVAHKKNSNRFFCGVSAPGNGHERDKVLCTVSPLFAFISVLFHDVQSPCVACCLCPCLFLFLSPGSTQLAGVFKDLQVFILDIYNYQIYPGDGPAKKAIDCDVPIKSRTSDDEYLGLLKKHLTASLEKFNPVNDLCENDLEFTRCVSFLLAFDSLQRWHRLSSRRPFRKSRHQVNLLHARIEALTSASIFSQCGWYRRARSYCLRGSSESQYSYCHAAVGRLSG